MDLFHRLSLFSLLKLCPRLDEPPSMDYASSFCVSFASRRACCGGRVLRPARGSYCWHPGQQKGAADPSVCIASVCRKKRKL